ncbi:RNP-1 like RNA-binding protein [Catenovulum agarivorans DS-2]|uniref:RNP-1 like RNA-binding protein n=1 Tax=Catenovulum agarivorans DS-2 TaxID=1328313 RepID=W7QR55_9ALTE|nr:RNA-binding protein [Catenovulum agarivorans]EWH10353.1 RNP-1 like RNA-binding protein [Catenovulum agarivorans DS-2]
MSNVVIKQALVIVVLALVSFFIVPALSINIEANIALALGVIVGGATVIFLTPASATEAQSTNEPSKTLYVGNLPYRANEAAVRELFAQHGDVRSVRLMRDRNTGKRKGFGFVEINESCADKAINALNDQEFQQRTLKVREAKDKTQQDNDSNA